MSYFSEVIQGKITIEQAEAKTLQLIESRFGITAEGVANTAIQNASTVATSVINTAASLANTEIGAVIVKYEPQLEQLITAIVTEAFGPLAGTVEGLLTPIEADGLTLLTNALTGAVTAIVSEAKTTVAAVANTAAHAT